MEDEQRHTVGNVVGCRVSVAAISKYFRDHNPQQISNDKSGRLEAVFDILEVKYKTESEDYANFPPMAQDKDDGTYGVH